MRRNLNLGIVVLSNRILSNIHPVDVGGRKKQKMLLPSDDGVEIFIMVFVERCLGQIIPNPEVHGIRKASEGLGCPGKMRLAVPTERLVL